MRAGRRATAVAAEDLVSRASHSDAARVEERQQAADPAADEEREGTRAADA